MKCPKCERGRVRKVTLKAKKEIAFLCNFCETLWFEGEEIKETSGHSFEILNQGGAVEYTLDPPEDKDLDDASIEYTHAK